MDGVPVANESENQQQESDQQQAASFLGINRVPLMLVRSIVLALSGDHRYIVRRARMSAVTGLAVTNLVQIPPIRPNPHLHQQRHRERVDSFHLLADQ